MGRKQPTLLIINPCPLMTTKTFLGAIVLLLFSSILTYADKPVKYSPDWLIENFGRYEGKKIYLVFTKCGPFRSVSNSGVGFKGYSAVCAFDGKNYGMINVMVPDDKVAAFEKAFVIKADAAKEAKDFKESDLKKLRGFLLKSMQGGPQIQYLEPAK